MLKTSDRWTIKQDMDWTSITMICQWQILAIGVERKIYNIATILYVTNMIKKKVEQLFQRAS